MIKVQIDKNIIEVIGHANFNPKGKDIVCASVSSIIFTSVNGILNIDKDAIVYKDDNKVMSIEIVKNDSITKKLIDNMLVLLEDLSRQYPDQLQICKGE